MCRRRDCLLRPCECRGGSNPSPHFTRTGLVLSQIPEAAIRTAQLPLSPRGGRVWGNRGQSRQPPSGVPPTPPPSSAPWGVDGGAPWSPGPPPARALGLRAEPAKARRGRRVWPRKTATRPHSEGLAAYPGHLPLRPCGASERHPNGRLAASIGQRERADLSARPSVLLADVAPVLNSTRGKFLLFLSIPASVHLNATPP